MNSGSGDSLKVSVRWGLSPNARQIRLTADWVMPVAAAIDRVDQWVASGGRLLEGLDDHRLDPSSSSMLRGAPGRGSSTRPSRRSTLEPGSPLGRPSSG